MSDGEVVGERATGDAGSDAAAGPPASNPKPKMSRARKIRLAIVVLFACAVGSARLVPALINYHRTTTPQAEGYHRYGTVRGTTFWLRSNGMNTFLLRTTGKLGGQCGYNGPDLDNPRLTAVLGDGGYLTVCDVSGFRGPRMIVYLVSASAGPARVQLSDGTTVAQTGAIDPSQIAPSLLPSQLLEVVLVNDPGAKVEDTTFG